MSTPLHTSFRALFSKTISSRLSLMTALPMTDSIHSIVDESMPRGRSFGMLASLSQRGADASHNGNDDRTLASCR